MTAADGVTGRSATAGGAGASVSVGAPEGVRIGVIDTHAGRAQVTELFGAIWGMTATALPVNGDLLVALTHSGACVLGAWRGDRLIGAAVAAAGAPHADTLYSIVAGVAADEAGSGVGRALKLAQRHWGLARGVRAIEWSYDPLVRRNAHFNLNRLGAGVRAFVPDYYPPMDDEVNRGDLPDRFVCEWILADKPGPRAVPAGTLQAQPALGATPSGEPVRTAYDLTEATVVTVATPADVETLRRTDHACALRWRGLMRVVATELFESGWRPIGVDAGGRYVFVPAALAARAPRLER